MDDLETDPSSRRRGGRATGGGTPLLGRIRTLLASLELTIVLLSALMVLVLACTLAQVSIGTFEAVKVYIRSFFVWWGLPGSTARIPIFPGGALVGLALAVNLVAAQLFRLELSWRRLGLWIAHLGLVVLLAGEFATGLFQVESRLAIEEGQTADFVERTRDLELAILEIPAEAGSGFRELQGIPESVLARTGDVPVPVASLTLRVKGFYRNAELVPRQSSDGPAPATVGIGKGFLVRELPPSTTDDHPNRTVVLVEPSSEGRGLGTYMLSNQFATPQQFESGGHRYALSLRPARQYLTYSLTLKDFRHEVYPGTDIPKNFSSLVRITNPLRHEERDVLISMNQPLRYMGKAFYQASFGKGDTLSVLQVVDNPGWLLPYVACVLVSLGLIIHFGISLSRWLSRRLARAKEA